MIFNVLFYWDLTGEGVADAVEDAKKDLRPVQNFPVQPGQHLQIYGYAPLRIDRFDHRGDRP